MGSREGVAHMWSCLSLRLGINPKMAVCFFKERMPLFTYYLETLIRRYFLLIAILTLQVLWSREEGLSRVTASLFVDFPLEKPGTATDSEHRRDHFGFRKLVLSVTDVCAFLSVSLTNQTGNIFGLHTVKGTLLWSRHYPGLAFEKLFLTKRSVDEEDQTEAIAYGFASLVSNFLTSV